MNLESSADRLKILGKRAAAEHLSKGVPMNDAVSRVLTNERGLGPEHVRRVVEFANNDAFQGKFEQEDGDHRVVNIEGGPADPSYVLKELNMGATPTHTRPPATFGDLFEDEFVPGADSAGDVFDTAKEASVAVDMPHANPHGDLFRLQEQLCSIKDTILSKIAMVELTYEEAGGQLYGIAKQAVLNGLSPAEVSAAITAAGVQNSSLVKEALGYISRRMERDNIELPPEKPISKFASNRVLNVRHPLVVAYNDFCKATVERYDLIKQANIVQEQLDRVNRAVWEVMR